jgi:hypothetical protein
MNETIRVVAEIVVEDGVLKVYYQDLKIEGGKIVEVGAPYL